MMGQAGGRMLAVAISLFAFASVISFCLYGQRCIEYLFPNSRMALPLYRLLFLTGCAGRLLCPAAAGLFAGGSAQRLPAVAKPRRPAHPLPAGL